MPHRPAVYLAVPVDDLPAVRDSYGRVLGLPEGRSTDHWVDRNLEGHQLVTHRVPAAPQPVGTSLVGQHRVPIPHYGLLLNERHFHRFAERLRAAGVEFETEPHRRFPGDPASSGPCSSVTPRATLGSASPSAMSRWCSPDEGRTGHRWIARHRPRRRDGLAAGGDRVAVHYAGHRAEAEETLRQLPGTGHTLLQADLGEPGAAERAVTEAVAVLGTVDVLVNNAAVAPTSDTRHPITRTSLPH